MSEGYGWAISETGSPLAGMAHGNSGFLMAYANLYSVSANRKYLDKIRLLLEYEDSLFVPEVGNWMDLRCGDKPGYMNAWCHGAPGILLSRLQLLKCIPENEEKMLRTVHVDVARAAKCLFETETDEKLCLCHGMVENLLIMKKYLEEYGQDQPGYIEDKMKQQYKNLLIKFLCCFRQKRLSAREYAAPGFMNGISGMGIALMEINKSISVDADNI